MWFWFGIREEEAPAPAPEQQRAESEVSERDNQKWVSHDSYMRVKWQLFESEIIIIIDVMDKMGPAPLSSRFIIGLFRPDGRHGGIDDVRVTKVSPNFADSYQTSNVNHFILLFLKIFSSLIK